MVIFDVSQIGRESRTGAIDVIAFGWVDGRLVIYVTSSGNMPALDPMNLATQILEEQRRVMCHPLEWPQTLSRIL